MGASIFAKGARGRSQQETPARGAKAVRNPGDKAKTAALNGQRPVRGGTGTRAYVSRTLARR